MHKKVRLTNPNSEITMAAGARTHFGAAVVRTAAGAAAPVKATTETNILGIVGDDEVKHTPYDGFWNSGNPMPIITEGKVRALVVANGSDVNVEAGDYLEVADLASGSQAGRHGLLEEAGSTAGGTRTATSVARAIEDCIMGDESYQVPDSVAVGDTTITFSSAELTNLDLDVGDLILLEDLNGELQVNGVADLTSTVVTLVIPSTVALTSGNSDLVSKIFQVAVVLI